MNTLTRLPATALAVLLPLSVSAQDPQATLGEFFSPDRIATALANTGISALRTRMELRYDHLSADPMRGTVAMSGIVARPVLPYDQAGQCEIRVDRATLSTDVIAPFQTSATLNLNLIGARASLACFERDIAVALRTAGYRDVPLDQFKVSATYAYTTGETALDTTVAINGFGILDVSASGTILPRIGEFGSPGDPAIRLSRAVATLKDTGGWAAVSQVLPPNLRDPLAIRELSTEALTQFVTEGGFRPLGAVERNFIDDLMAEVETFVADPGEITIEADLPAGGVVVEPQMYASLPSLIVAMGLQARSTPLARTRILTLEELAAVERLEDLAPEDRLRIATALLNGDGVPRSTVLVPGLLAPLLDDPEVAGEVALLLSKATEARDIATAYDYALIAGERGTPGAVGQLDRLEAQMTSQAVLTAQAVHLEPAPAPVSAISSDDPRDLRALALAHHAGQGAARSYARAYYYAVLAEAAGDIAAGSLRADIEGRFAARGPDVAAAWQQTATRMEELAIGDWFDADLPQRYLTQR
ncbi:hypothetical protein [Yoonia vestfoldensis]|uniref:hypothetical protein n=1 Tax=Yoonia vestfoldensis TaxID=245188 RepID=UPI00037D27B1|nr:hypothetical protein [Yoonia vestfoldensis]